MQERGQTMYEAKEYTYRVFWYEPDQEYVGTVAEFPSLSHLDGSPEKALDGIMKVVADVLEDMVQDGEEDRIPEPLGKRHYSGRFALRMSEEQHRRVAMEAAEQGVSINTLLVSRI